MSNVEVNAPASTRCDFDVGSCGLALLVLHHFSDFGFRVWDFIRISGFGLRVSPIWFPHCFSDMNANQVDALLIIGANYAF
jgi:hypothetical protein